MPSYDDTVVFIKNQRKNIFTFSEESDDLYSKVLMFHCPRRDYWFSYVSFDQILVTKFIRLSVENLCQWLRVEPFDPDCILQWQIDNKILLKYHAFDTSKTRQNRNALFAIPGQLEPNWEPKLSIDLGINGFPFEYCYLFKKNESQTCEKNNCRFKTQRADRLQRHQNSCTGETKIKTKRVLYGKEEQVIDQLTIPESFLSEPVFKFACFDIETIETSSNIAEAKLSILSIGLASNLDSNKYYFERKSSAHEDGQFMINQFMMQVEDLATKYQSTLPPQVEEELAKIKQQEKEAYWFEKQQLFKKKRFLKDLLAFNVFGFNSSKFDLTVMVGYLLTYATQNNKKFNVLKKGSRYFNITIGNVIFKDILSFSAPCSLEKYLANWFDGKAKKSVFPYQYFQSIEQIRHCLVFPPYKAFYSDLKQCNISTEDYEEAKSEFNRCRQLSFDDPAYMANFSGKKTQSI